MANLSAFLESNFHIWGHESDFIKQFHVINNIAIYVLSPITTILLFYMIIFKSPVLFQGYRVVLLFANSVDCLLIVVMWFMNFTRLNAGYFAFITSWPTIPLTVQWIIYGCFMSSTTLESLTVMLEFWFRLVLIKTKKPPSLVRLFLVILFIIFLSGTSSFFVMGYFLSEDLCKTTSFVVFDTEKNPWGRLILPYRRFVIFVSFGLTILLAILSFRTLKQQPVSLSERAKKMLNDFTITLYVKNVAPIFMIIVPLLLRYAAKIYKMENWVIDEYISTMYFWLPFINSTLTLLLISHYRRVIIGAFKRLRLKANSMQTIGVY